MQKVLDMLDAVTGWSGENAVIGLTSHPEYCAGHAKKSLLVEISSGGYITKNYSVNVGDYDELVINLWSRNKAKYYYAKYTDYNYSIEVSNQKKYYIPAFSTLEPVHIPLVGIDTITNITITNETSGDDVIILSYMVMAGRRNEVVKDILDGVAEEITKKISEICPEIYIDEVDVEEGATLYVTSDTYLDANCIIKITDGNESEEHRVISIVYDGSKKKYAVAFGGDYDGDKIKNTMTKAKVYLVYKVIYNIREDTLVVPGIAIWSRMPIEDMKTSGLAEIISAVGDDLYYIKREPIEYTCEIMIDCISRAYSILYDLSEVVRRFIGQRKVWIQGRPFEIEPAGEPVLVEQMQPYQVVPKIQYIARLKLALDAWDVTQYAVCIKTTMEVEHGKV